jgi:hypothetical protein
LCADCHSDQHAESEGCKANVILSLAKIGYWNCYDLDSLCDILTVLTKEDLVNMFLEKANGTN